MTRLSTAISVLLAAALPAAAATSPLASASDYAFTHPAVTNAIRGIVLGDTGGYATLRYEDVAFLLEAETERDYLTRQSVSSNQFAEVSTSTNTVLKTPQITSRNIQLEPILARFLATNCEVSTSARIVTLTNVYPIGSWSSPTNVYPGATNYICQVMTNGVTDVYTNTLPQFASNILVRATVTNQTSYADFCMSSHVTTLKEDAKVRRGNGGNVALFTGPYSKSQMREYFGLIRSMRRKVPTGGGSNLAETDNAIRISSGSSSTTTNLTTSSEYYAYILKNRDAEDNQTRTGDTWSSDTGYPSDVTTFSKTFTIPQSLPMRIVTDLSDILITHGNHIRANVADVFALVSASYRRDLDSYHTIQSGTVTDVNVETNLYGEVMIPVGQATRQSGHPTLTLTINVPTSIYQSAADELGFPFIGEPYNPSLPSVGTAQWDTDGSTRHKKTMQRAIESYTASITLFYILHLNPKTKLQSWSEYD